MTGEDPHTSIDSIEWPAFVTGNAAMLLALQQQLDASQWWPAERHAEHQFRQLRHLVAHAYDTVPFYRPRLDAMGYRAGQEITPDFWRHVPILHRRELNQSFADMVSTAVPAAHGKQRHDESSGSTGTPIRVVKTTIVDFFWRGVTLREALWHRHDRSAKLAVIRAGLHKIAPAPDGAHEPDWGLPVAVVYPTGPLAMLDIAAPVAEQAAWLVRENPGYLVTVPSNLLALARHFRENRLALPALRGIKTVGEVVDLELRDLCREVWRVGLIDVYSCVEAGYIALQCPLHLHYHVQSESALVEVLNPDGSPCRPGEQGRVVLTPLHNFAMPLLRYAVGDIAEIGEPCACGRGLPVLKRVLGRVRGTLALPSGERVYPTGFTRKFNATAGLVQYQIVQQSLERVELRLVVRPPFTEADEDELRRHLAAALGSHFAVAVRYCDEIPRAPSGKYFDFMSEVAD